MLYASNYTRIDIGLSEVCNLSCLMCRRPQEKAFIASEIVHKVLQDAKRIGVRTLSFSGGEPFIHPDFREFLVEAINLGFEVELVTNGTLVLESDIEVFEKLKCVTVSIDGPESAHDYIRGLKGAWRKSMDTLRLLSESKACWGTNTVIQKDNAELLYETWLAVTNIGKPRYVAFTHVEVVPETAHLLPTDEQLAMAKQQVDKVMLECAEYGTHFNDAGFMGELFNIFADKSQRFRPFYGCDIPKTFLGVSQYGVFPCWHQGEYIPLTDGLIEALLTEQCNSIIGKGLEKKCIGCNAANYSWSSSWLDGVIMSHEYGQREKGIVYLSELERQEGRLLGRSKSIPIVERNA
jgi:MoaA/NifB/PqqE/SkfB family radical SAM enzyme